MKIELSPNTKANLLAVIAILGILGVLWIALHASNREVESYGPTAVTATADGELYFDAIDQMHQASAGGALLHSASFSELGIVGPIAQLSMVESDLLLLDAGQNEILRCETDLWRCLPLFATLDQPLPEILAYALAPEQDQLYLATGNNHRIIAYDLDGRERYTLKVPQGLRYINDIQWLGQDHLLVTDTNHHRVIELEDLGGGEVRLVQQLESKNAIGRQGRKWPTEAVRDNDGGTWVINSNGLLRDGDLIYYDANGEPQHWIELDAESGLNGLTRYPGGVLVSESESQQLLFVARSDFSVTRFGDESLHAMLNQISQQKLYWQRAYYISLGVGLFFLSLGMIAGYLDWQTRKSLQRETKAEPPTFADGKLVIPDEIKARLSPDAEGIYWLSIERKNLRKLQFISLLFPLMLIWLFYTTFSPSADGLMWPLYLSGMMMVVLSAVLMWMILVALPRIRLGSDGNRLFLVDILGRRASALPDACIRTESRLLIGKIAVSIKHRSPIFFDKALFSAIIEPILSQVPKHSEFHLFWRNLRNGDLTTWLAVLTIALVLVKEIWF
ncbi:MAG: hypothetical protein KZQ85_03170 [Candidatus Thiodiazotropha sp. (ex Myrtea sp. 'scaly one' KF741663)]|nr:hypothetical protein [Candidatus Thiodiazotropha sp. (ex Myrtea sp. 'scaly one' KF741663)]